MLRVMTVLSDTRSYPVSTVADNDNESPVLVTLDAVNGGRVIRKLLLHNEDPDVQYENVSVSINTADEQNPIPPELTLKLIVSSRIPTEDDFADLPNMNMATLSDPILPGEAQSVWLFAEWPGTLSLNQLESAETILNRITLDVTSIAVAVEG